jgi:3-oxoacyl-[acyl-carrier protein] reductase
MDLKIKGQHFIVCGASSGFGYAIAQQLLDEGAECTLVARRGDLLKKHFETSYPERVTILEADLTLPETIDEINDKLSGKDLHGVVLNAGGPPTGTPLDTTMDQWDDAYKLVMRWKINLVLRLAPRLADHGYGRILFIESKTIKQPLPSLVLSNSFRAGIAGFAKSLSSELASNGVTVNIIGPGSHNTPAIERVIKKRSETLGITIEQSRKEMEKNVPVGRFGEAVELASLAAWVLSPHAGYVTGQTISHDGGSIAGIFG